MTFKERMIVKRIEDIVMDVMRLTNQPSTKAGAAAVQEIGAVAYDKLRRLKSDIENEAINADDI
tara:strand:+ start:398 stop:589 length:192 start_codon:yes stop_codon:yes gene_type:complete